MIGEGTWRARAVTMAFINSSKKGTPGIEVAFCITEGPHKGANIGWTGWMTPATQERTAESLQTCGFDGEDVATVTKNEVFLVVEHETYAKDDGTVVTRAKVAWVNSLERGVGSQPMDSAKAAEVKANLRGLIMAKKQSAPAPVDTGAPKMAPKF
jgi:hypothetical protein